MIRVNDYDGDGQVSLEEFVFAEFDKDENRFISAAELRQVITLLTDEEAKENIGNADNDNDGQVNYEEFVTMILFDNLDKDENGFISAAELGHVTSLTDAEIDEWIRKADKDSDKQINYEEFLTICPCMTTTTDSSTDTTTDSTTDTTTTDATTTDTTTTDATTTD